jgi:hypothetical protein
VRVLVQVREPVLGAAQEMETGRAMATASRCPPQGHHHRKRTTRTTLPAHRAVYSCSTPYMGAGRHRSARAKANRDEAALASTESGARGGGLSAAERSLSGGTLARQWLARRSSHLPGSHSARQNVDATVR